MAEEDTDTRSEPYVRLATLRQLHQVVTDLHAPRSVADTLQAVADGVAHSLGYALVAVNMVSPNGDLILAAFAGRAPARPGTVTPRETWEQRLTQGERWGTLRFVSWSDPRQPDSDDAPEDSPAPSLDGWHPNDRLYAPMYASRPIGGELIGVISVGKPTNGRHPGPWGREALQMYAFQAAIAINNAQLRAKTQPPSVQLDHDQRALRASEERFRQAFEYAPSGMGIAEMGGDQDGKLLRVNDALCRLLGRSASTMWRYSLSDLVHPEDSELLLTLAEGGRAELRLARGDGTYVWVSLRNSVVADTVDGPHFLIAHVAEIEERGGHEFQLAPPAASLDPLTGLPNSAELRARIRARLCPGQRNTGDDAATIQATEEMQHLQEAHVHVVPPDENNESVGKGLAVLFCDLDGFKSINDRFGHPTGDAVLIEVGRRLADTARHGDTVARLGGDEFVVLADGLAPADAADLAVRLRNAIILPIRVDGHSIRTGASFGIGWARCGMTPEEILHSADQQMYAQKRATTRASSDTKAG
ncbi:diguanylate cyclase [Streptomyces sp. H39-S7]|nr:diguanylate cyclase [Streptomyces sp. H39-S7]MCZ4120197.1 diguanylate cyclase [Streptomyces sp. H39-S7]